MSFLSDSVLQELSSHLIDTLQLADVTVESLCEAFKSFELGKSLVEEPPVAAPPKPTPKAATSGKAAVASKAAAKGKAGDTEEKHPCEYTVKGDNPHVCGKTGKTTLFEGLWYCGTEKSGHLSSVMKNATKVIGKSTAKPSAGAPKAAASAAKPAAPKAVVPSKGVPKEEKINLVQVGEYFIHPKRRIAFKKGTKLALGILDKDNVTLKPLDDEAKRFCEKCMFEIPAAKPKAGAVAKPPAKAASSKSLAAKASAKPSAVKAVSAKPSAAKAAAKNKGTEEDIDLGQEEAAPETDEVAETPEGEDVAEEQVDIQLGEEGEEEPDVEEETAEGGADVEEEGEGEGEEDGEGEGDGEGGEEGVGDEGGDE